MLEKQAPKLNEELLTNVVAQMNIAVPNDAVGFLYEHFHETRFVESVWYLREQRSLTRHEIQLMEKVSRHCQAVQDLLVGVPGDVCRSFAGLDASALVSYATQEPDWLVQDVFTIDEPLLVGARSKGCKTLQLTDLAVAVASDSPDSLWMNTFAVPKRRKVLFITGESNYRRTSKHILQACKVRGLELADLRDFLRVEAIEFPSLPSIDDQDAIRRDVEAYGIELVICDPLYRGLTGVDASRLSEMGQAIKSFQRACAPACLILSHHVIKAAAKDYGQAG